MLIFHSRKVSPKRPTGPAAPRVLISTRGIMFAVLNRGANGVKRVRNKTYRRLLVRTLLLQLSR